MTPSAQGDVAEVGVVDAHLQRSADLAHRLGVNLDVGLAAGEVAARLERHGPNRLPEAPPRAAWMRLLDQFRDFKILVLLAAAVLSGLIGDITDTPVILTIVVLNAAIGFWLEWRADQALQALRRMAAPRATVRRDDGASALKSPHEERDFQGILCG